ncbi:transporter substrate-binding domain-containing protein [Marinomonas colpomeniae]|uniref:histidine kinase n=1 Tax=Marinomonas colpomeniae TaxID=2774408 RepID=A0ABR8NXX1_9GAMM|nr:transporter substrate-binding domain-containing protein [Marinomonas colpomeniae]MBD5770364.1 transporter substrate-binding domain-containing protein [Marinomonas colpomeniae]
MKNKKHLIQAYFISLLLVPFTVTAKDIRDSHSKILIGGDHNYPPYEFINEQGQPDGYNTELTRAIAEVMGIDIEIQLGNWDKMRDSLTKGDIDVLQGMVYSKDRSQNYDFAPPHAIINQSIFARKGEAKVSSLSALTGKEVIVQEGGIMHDYLLQQNVNAKLILVDTHAAALRMLASGKHDYALVANLPGLYLGRELELSNITPVGKPFGTLEYGYAVPKNHPQLLAQFSEGLAILKNTGRQQAIYEKWLGALEKPYLPWEKIGLFTGIASAILLLILSGIVIWNRMLTRQVLLRTNEIRLQHEQLIQADKMASLGVLVAGVAHEINNPSSLLLLNLPVIKEMYQDIEPILEEHYSVRGDFDFAGLTYSRLGSEIPTILDDMLAGTQRIRRIVNDLRDFAHQRPVDSYENVDLNEVLAISIRLVDNTIRKSTDNFQVHYGSSLPLFLGNAQQIEQVIINLIVNACQALDDVNKGITINTYYLHKTNKLYLEVIDQGCGIKPSDLPSLCDPFFTTKREEGGTGLGLSISSSIINDHGGTLTHSSELDKGTSVVISLPEISRAPLI